MHIIITCTNNLKETNIVNYANNNKLIIKAYSEYVYNNYVY